MSVKKYICTDDVSLREDSHGYLVRLEDYTTIEAELATLKEQKERLVKLLQAAKCPNCKGDGVIVLNHTTADLEIEQCQWCFEKNEALISTAPLPYRNDPELVKDKERLDILIKHQGCVVRNEDAETLEMAALCLGEVWEFYDAILAQPIGVGKTPREAIDSAALKRIEGSEEK